VGVARAEPFLSESGSGLVAEHRWQIDCSMTPDEAERELTETVEGLVDEAEVIEHIETVGFFGWTLRMPDERAVGVSVPQPGGPDKLVVRSEHPELGEHVAERLTDEGPLAGRSVAHVDRG
jgi:predicted NBD/HSP70 family sugar kinase